MVAAKIERGNDIRPAAYPRLPATPGAAYGRSRKGLSSASTCFCRGSNSPDMIEQATSDLQELLGLEEDRIVNRRGTQNACPRLYCRS